MLKKSVLRFGLAFVAGVACLLNAGRGDPPRDLHEFVWFTPSVVHDDLDNRDAFSLLIPKGWKIDARILWRYDPFYPIAALSSVYNPEGTESVVSYPMLNFNDGIRQGAMRTASVAGPQAVANMALLYADGNYYLGAEIRPRAASPEEYLKKYLIPRFRPALKDATIVGSENEPPLAAALSELYGNMPGLDIKVSLIHMAYQSSGIDMEEDFVVILGMLPMPGNTVSWSGSGCSYRAMKGSLKAAMPILRTIQASTRIDVAWFNDIEQAKTIMQQIQANELNQAMIRSRIIANLQTHISQTIQETFLHRQKVQSRCDEQWDHVIRGSQTVPDPNHPGRNVHVPNGYDHIYLSGDGTQYIATNDSNFNPGSVNGGFTELHAR